MSDQRNFSSAWSLFSIYCSIFFVLFHFLAFSVVVGEASGNELGNPSIAITKWIRKWSLKEERAAAHGGISSFGWWNYRLSFDMWTPLQLTRRVIIVCFHFFFSFIYLFSESSLLGQIRFIRFISWNAVGFICSSKIGERRVLSKTQTHLFQCKFNWMNLTSTAWLVYQKAILLTFVSDELQVSLQFFYTWTLISN